MDFSLFLDEEVLAIAEEAHRLSMHIACYAYDADGIRKVAEGGVDTSKHGIFVNEEIANILVQKGTYLIPTQIAMRMPPDILQQFPREVIKEEKEIPGHMAENHRLTFEKGVAIAVRTYSGAPVIPHGTNGIEIKNKVENIGMTQSQTLQAAMIRAAEAIKMDNDIGSIEKGKYADLVICERNPLENLATLEEAKNFDYVIKDGKIMVKRGKITYFARAIIEFSLSIVSSSAPLGSNLKQNQKIFCGREAQNYGTALFFAWRWYARRRN
ncbi:MAG: amidohydrolase family protein [Candidatus Hodarchaeota archaeon]